MKAKLNVGKLLTLIEKGMTSIILPPKPVGPLSDFGKLVVSPTQIGGKTSSQRSSSYCIVQVDSNDQIEVNGNCTVSMPKLRSMLKSLSADATVELEFFKEVDGDTLGHVLFKSGKSSWKMPSVDPKTIAEAKLGKGTLRFKMPCSTLSDAIKNVAFAGNLKDANFVQSNVCISVRDQHVYFGATDDIRLAAFTFEVVDKTEDCRLLVPLDVCAPLFKAFEKGEIEVYSGDGFIGFSQGDHFVRLSLPPESDVDRFPDFEALVTAEQVASIKVMTTRFAEIVNACNDMNKEECLLKISGDTMHVYAYDSIDGMSYHSSLTCSGDKLDIVLGLCPVYFVDFLKKIDEETLCIVFPQADGKPRQIKALDGQGRFFVMKALVDLVHVPPETEVEKKNE